MPKSLKQDLVLQAEKLRDAILNAVLYEHVPLLPSLFRRLWHLEVSAESLLVSGLPHLLREPALFQLANDKGLSQTRAKHVLLKWKQLAPGAVLSKVKVDVLPLKGFRLRTFQEHVRLFETWLLDTVEGHGIAPPCHRRVAFVFALLGFARPMELEGVDVESLHRFCHTPADRALLERALREAEQQGVQNRAKRYKSASWVASTAMLPASASCMAATLASTNLREREATLQQTWQGLGVAGLGTLLKPMQTVTALTNAKTRNATAVLDALQQQADFVKLASQRKSLPSVAAGLRCWHGFAVGVLAYPEGATLPPRKAAH
eukprot:6467214-Amphidinium_carterae.1